MLLLGHSRPGRTSGKSGHVRHAPEAEVNSEQKRLRDELLRLNGIAVEMIQAPKLEPRMMRYQLSDYEWTTIKPMPPNKQRGVPRVSGRRVLNSIFWVLRSAPN